LSETGNEFTAKDTKDTVLVGPWPIFPLRIDWSMEHRTRESAALAVSRDAETIQT